MSLHTAAPAGAIELKGEGDDPVAVVTAALDSFKGEVIGRLEKVEAAQGAKAELEAKGINDKLVDRLDKIEAKLNRPAGGGRSDEMSPERKAMLAYLRHGQAAPADELKALTVTALNLGGYLVPPEWSREVIRGLTEFSPIRSIASVRTTSNYGVLYPRRMAITNATWRGEIAAAEGSEPEFGQVQIWACELKTYVDVSNQLLADSDPQAETEVQIALAEDFAAKEGAAFIGGAGTDRPTGILAAASGLSYTANGHATNLSSDALITLMYAMPAFYRNRGTWLMNGSTLAAIRKLKDSQGNYLWQSGLTAGQPETILGRPVVEAVDMPNIAADAFPIVFGDFETGYRIVDRADFSLLVNPYIRATEGITRIHANRRVGGLVIQSAALRKLKMATS